MVDKKCGNCNTEKTLDQFRVCTDKRCGVSYPCSWCKECERKRALERYKQNREACMKKNKEYKKNNPDKINETRRIWMRNRMKDNVERIKRDLKCLISAKIKKTKHTTEYLGTSVSLIVKWLEWNFDDGMNWENHGTLWQIDHTQAINTFNLLDGDQCMLCFNWKNLMPMYTSMNTRKKDAVIPYRIFYQEYRLRKFFKIEQIDEDLNSYLKSYRDHFSKTFGDTIKFRGTPKAFAYHLIGETL